MYRAGSAVLRGAVRARFLSASLPHANFSAFPRFSAGLRLHDTLSRITLGAKRFYSDRNEKEPEEPIESSDSSSLELYNELGGMSPINVPNELPNVPILAINRYPLFPGFIKKVDVSLN
uniref:Lon N-terminal domain-containing protein n=1 Tax=Caenorhabditis japonica TaxID=281687 RepID=A0A8R1EHR6_CAEJA